MKHQQHRNQVRICGGVYRGRKLAFPSIEGLRPTPEMVRERLFNWLGQDLTGLSVLDAFAGSGALGFEALSRHAKSAILLDSNGQVIRALRQNVQLLDCANQAEICQTSTLAWLTGTVAQFDVVFLDPPFAWQQWVDLWRILHKNLKNGAQVYLEAGKIPDLPSYLTIRKTGKSGMSQYVLAQYDEALH